jgi:hypothetical protein
MPIRAAKRHEAQLWLNKFNKHLSAWLGSQREDDEQIRLGISSLRSAMEREPEMAETVSALCAMLAHQHSELLAPDLAERLAKLGLEAEMMRSDSDPMRWAERAMLKLGLARAGDNQDRSIEALDAVRSIDLPDSDSPLRTYFGARVDDELAGLYDAGLDWTPARKHSKAVLDACDKLLIPENTATLVGETLRIFFRDAQSSKGMAQPYLQIAWQDLARMQVFNVVRAARCARAEGGLSTTEAAELLEAALDRLRKFGLSTLSPLDLIPLFRGASEEQCSRILDIVSQTAKKVGIEQEPFRIVLTAAAAAYGTPSSSRRTDFKSASSKLSESLLLQTTHAGLEVVAGHRNGIPIQECSDQFTAGLRKLSSYGALTLRTRAEFDAPVSILLEERVRQVVGDPAPVNHRISLAWLLDSLRTAPKSGLKWLALLPSKGEGPSSLKKAMHHADDPLGRLVFALASWPTASVIILQSLGEKMLFVCVTGKGIESHQGEEDFRSAAREATELLADQAALFFDLQIPPDDEAVRNAGEKAFDAMPARVRELIRKSEVLLICPDFRSETDSIPFEAFVCDEAYLGVSKIVTRVSSIEAAVRAAEGTVRRVSEKRALAMGITAATQDRLECASDEAEDVRTVLAMQGWDAPIIQESRVAASFILNRTPFAAHLHVAAHGVAGGGQEAVLLPKGGRLTSEDVLNRSFGCTPTVWLNTCELGQTRYAGGGAVRGIAQAFLEAGSPAVIASLLRVEDRTSALLASRFYSECARYPFGEALRRSREETQQSGVSPVLWGTTVLMGDPRISLDPAKTASIEWQKKLVLAIKQIDDPAALSKLAKELKVCAKASPKNIRLACAAGLVSALRELSAKGRASDPWILADILRTCLKIHVLEGAALLGFFLSELMREEETVALMTTEGAIALLRPVEGEDDSWQQLTNKLLVRTEQIRRGDRALQPRSIGGGAEEEIGDKMAMASAFMEIKMAIDLRSRWYGLSPVPRSSETTAEDILWNAVMATRTKTFEDMPETFAYCGLVASKLAGQGVIGPDRVELASVMLSGLLKWQWDSQNTVAIEEEFIEGQTATACLALSSFEANWQASSPWMQVVADYGGKSSALLEATQYMPYDEALYKAIQAAIDQIEGDGISRLEKAQKKYPERAPDAMLFLLGSLVKINTYSYIDGSVPEHICEKLNGVYNKLCGRALDVLAPWIKEAFEPVSKMPMDELRRWCYHLETVPKQG